MEVDIGRVEERRRQRHHPAPTRATRDGVDERRAESSEEERLERAGDREGRQTQRRREPSACEQKQRVAGCPVWTLRGSDLEALEGIGEGQVAL